MARLVKHRLLSRHIKYQLLPSHQKLSSLYLSLSVHFPKEPEVSKVGFIIRRKIGKAVYRNKLRRQLREVFFQISSKLDRSIWVLINVKPACKDISAANFRLEATKLLKKV